MYNWKVFEQAFDSLLRKYAREVFTAQDNEGDEERE